MAAQSLKLPECSSTETGTRVSENARIKWGKIIKGRKQSRIRETLNLSTDADHRTDSFFLGGDGEEEKNI